MALKRVERLSNEARADKVRDLLNRMREGYSYIPEGPFQTGGELKEMRRRTGFKYEPSGRESSMVEVRTKEDFDRFMANRPFKDVSTNDLHNRIGSAPEHEREQMAQELKIRNPQFWLSRRDYGVPPEIAATFPPGEGVSRFARPELRNDLPEYSSDNFGDPGRFATPELTGGERMPMLSPPTEPEGPRELSGGRNYGRYSDIINEAAKTHGLNPDTLATFIRIESAGNPNAQMGSYKGLLQMSDREFAKHSNGGDVFNPRDNIMAGAKKISEESARFKQQYGTDPTPGQLYMVHQQGEAGYRAHSQNLDQTAWKNIRPYYSSDNMAKKAVWGNLGPEARARFGNVENVTSRGFLDTWSNRVDGTPAAVVAQRGQPQATSTIDNYWGDKAQTAVSEGRTWPVPSIAMADVPRSGGSPNSREHGGPRAGGGRHAGLDIPAPVGGKVLAPGNGTILKMGNDGRGYGSFIDMKLEDGTIHRFGHLGDSDKGGKQGPFAQGLAIGNTVKAGDVIGFSGYSGNAESNFPHVHYEIFPGQKAYDASAGRNSRESWNLRMNPRSYYPTTQTATAPGPMTQPMKQAAAAQFAKPDQSLTVNMANLDQMKDEAQPQEAAADTTGAPPETPVGVPPGGGIGSDYAASQFTTGGTMEARPPATAATTPSNLQTLYGADPTQVASAAVSQPPAAAPPTPAASGTEVASAGGSGGGMGGLLGDIFGGGGGGLFGLGGGKMPAFKPPPGPPPLPDLGAQILNVAGQEPNVLPVTLPAPPPPVPPSPPGSYSYAKDMRRRRTGFA